MVREIGGEKDGIGMKIPGAARFSQGEEVVVFATDRAQADGAYDLRGLMLSKLNVREESSGEERLTGPAITMGETATAGEVVHDDDLSGEPGGPAEESQGRSGPGRSGKKPWTVQSLRSLIERQGGSGGAPSALNEKNPANSGVQSSTAGSASSLLNSQTVEDIKASGGARTGDGNQAPHPLTSQDSTSVDVPEGERDRKVSMSSTGIFAAGVLVAVLILVLIGILRFARRG
jgi:hypothetical protein